MFFVAVGITLILPFGQYMGPWLPLLLLGIPFLAGGCGTGCAVRCNRPGWGIANLAVAILYQDFPFALADLFLKRALTLLALVTADADQTSVATSAGS